MRARRQNRICWFLAAAGGCRRVALGPSHRRAARVSRAVSPSFAEIRIADTQKSSLSSPVLAQVRARAARTTQNSRSRIPCAHGPVTHPRARRAPCARRPCSSLHDRERDAAAPVRREARARSRSSRESEPPSARGGGVLAPRRSSALVWIASAPPLGNSVCSTSPSSKRLDNLVVRTKRVPRRRRCVHRLRASLTSGPLPASPRQAILEREYKAEFERRKVDFARFISQQPKVIELKRSLEIVPRSSTTWASTDGARGSLPSLAPEARRAARPARRVSPEACALASSRQVLSWRRRCRRRRRRRCGDRRAGRRSRGRRRARARRGSRDAHRLHPPLVPLRRRAQGAASARSARALAAPSPRRQTLLAFLFVGAQGARR